jgi:ribonuclease-3 family protein
MNNIVKINTMSPLTWAYVGDAVYELYIRQHLVETTNLKPNKLHREATKFVRASAQAKILEKLKEYLTEEEQETVRRGRNTQNHHLPKNADPADYMYSTAFEGLIRIFIFNTARKKTKRNISKNHRN